MPDTRGTEAEDLLRELPPQPVRAEVWRTDGSAGVYFVDPGPGSHGHVLNVHTGGVSNLLYTRFF